VPNEFARGHVHFWGPFPYRSEFWSTSPEQEVERALHALGRLIEAEGPGSIAALLVETIPGTAGVIVPPAGWLAGLRALCDRWGIVLIFDEVMAGFGRTGDWFAFQNPQLNPEGIVPDLITFAKGVNSGYVPAGGVIIPPAIAAEFDTRVFPGGLTYSGHPLAMASIVATIDAMREEGIVENARRIGAEVLAPALALLADRHPVIGEVRGLGVFWALDLVEDRATKAPLQAAEMARIKGALVGAGLLPFVQDNRVHVVPPCIVTDDQVARAIAIYDAVLP
jgi:taurine--2-oxoglutarate transaminase